MEALFFAGEGGDGSDGTGCFAGELGGFFVFALVSLILQDDDTLEEEKKARKRLVLVDVISMRHVADSRDEYIQCR